MQGVERKCMFPWKAVKTHFTRIIFVNVCLLEMSKFMSDSFEIVIIRIDFDQNFWMNNCYLQG